MFLIISLKKMLAPKHVNHSNSRNSVTQISEFGETAAQPLSHSHELRTLLIDGMPHNPKRGVAALPTRQPRNGNTMSTTAGSGTNSSSSVETVGELSSAAPVVSPEFSALLGNLQAKKKSLHGYERTDGSILPTRISCIPNAPMSAPHNRSTTANMVNASSNCSVNQASTSSQQVSVVTKCVLCASVCVCVITYADDQSCFCLVFVWLGRTSSLFGIATLYIRHTQHTHTHYEMRIQIVCTC